MGLGTLAGADDEQSWISGYWQLALGTLSGTEDEQSGISGYWQLGLCTLAGTDDEQSWNTKVITMEEKLRTPQMQALFEEMIRMQQKGNCVL